ncbi:MAG: phosphotransferase [Gemmatimonadota bacterium]|nr:MAG: phosphotransferase [Gemmatimonadota bacterium]
MNSLPWEPDRPLTAQGARAAIAARFPEVDSRALEHLGSGWQFDVYLTPDGWVFRFPRRAWIADLFEQERRVHELVSRFLAPKIAVPKIELMGEPAEGFPHRFAGHRFISGVPADAVDADLEVLLAREIGEALGTIHSIPVGDARAAGVAELDMDEPGRKDWLERGLDRASQLRGYEPAIDPALDWVADLSLPLHEYDGPVRVIHHDLGPEHLIVEAKTGQLTGIVDWTDTILGDAARDFVGLVTWRGWGFTEEVLRSYRLPLDEGFRDRLRFMARLISTIWLTEAHSHGIDIARYVKGVRNAFAAGSAS